MSRHRRDDSSPASTTTAQQVDCWEALGETTTGQPAAGAGQRLAQLARTIEQEIIPRLMLAHRAAFEAFVPPGAPPPPVLDAAAVQAFTRLALHADDSRAWDHVQQLCAQGVTIEGIYLDLLAPAARHLGQLWNEDLCDFTEVTIGLGRLQRIMRELSPEFSRAAEVVPEPRRVLLLPSPGEQHTFGLVMVGEFFRRAGWDVCGGAWESGAQAPALVAAEWYDVLGLSLAADIHVDALVQCIAAARAASRNRGLVVLVGGPLFAIDPGCAERLGADIFSADGRKAPALAVQAIARRSRLD